MTHVIGQACVGAKHQKCLEVCPVNCIATGVGEASYYIDPQGCTDCGLCVLVCPVQAIYPAADLPAPWQRFVDINAAFFHRRDESSDTPS
jgi:ferredoxin